jgi:hypothetical protein
MHSLIHNTPIIELPASQTWYRIQRLKPLPQSLRLNGYTLPPPGIPVNRFDLADHPVAYLGDSALTALYEAVFRRDTSSRSLDYLRVRALSKFRSLERIRLADLRGQEEHAPFLVSGSYAATQKLAAQFFEDGLDGIMYGSAQHPFHYCVCLFSPGIAKTKYSRKLPLVNPKTGEVLTIAIDAAEGARVSVFR